MLSLKILRHPVYGSFQYFSRKQMNYFLLKIFQLSSKTLLQSYLWVTNPRIYISAGVVSAQVKNPAIPSHVCTADPLVITWIVTQPCQIHKSKSYRFVTVNTFQYSTVCCMLVQMLVSCVRCKSRYHQHRDVVAHFAMGEYVEVKRNRTKH